MEESLAATRTGNKKLECLNVLQKNNIVVFVRPANAVPWSDYGEIYDRGFDEIQFKNCRDRGTTILYKGRLYLCCRELRYVEKNLYSVEESTSVDLSEDVEKAREKYKMIKLKTIPYKGCRYCGDMNIKMEAGVQEEKNINILDQINSFHESMLLPEECEGG